jgi:ABC-2 type transport system permease protein
MALAFPMLLALFFGFAINFDVRNIPLTVSDLDQTLPSRTFIDTVRGTGLFIVKPADQRQTVTSDLDHERSDGVLIIEKGFAQDLRAGRNPKLQLLMDGANNATSGVVATYLAGLEPAAWNRLAVYAPQAPPPPPLNLRVRLLFNPELNSRWFIIPALSVLILGMIATQLAAVSLAREWELGSMELLLSTPAKPIEIIVGKLLPYLALGLAAVVTIFLCALVIFGVPFRGSLLLYGTGCLFFLVSCLAEGLLISGAVRQQMAAMQFSQMLTMLPNMMLSGFIFPVESMPLFFSVLTAFVPARWFIQISRALFLKGSGLRELGFALAVLFLMAFALVVFAVKSFKKDLEP